MNENAQSVEEITVKKEVYVTGSTNSISPIEAKRMMPELWDWVENHPLGIKFSLIWDSCEDVRYRGDYDQFTLQIHFPFLSEVEAYPIRTRSLECVYLHWDSCCAQGIISNLEWNLTYDKRIDKDEFLAALKPGFKRALRRLANVHQVQFAYSEEEITYQDEMAHALGFVDIAEPYLSCKTGNTIHNTMLNLASAEDEESARELYDDNHGLDDYYDGDDDGEEEDYWLPQADDEEGGMRG